MIRKLLAVTLFLCASMAAQAADLATKSALTLDVAKELVQAMEKRAAHDGWKVVICILDDGGNLLYLERMDGVQIGSIGVAMKKAESAFKFKRPTKAFGDRVADQPAVLQIPGGFAIEGGVPLMHGDQILGSIGVSGVTSQQDGMIAQAGVEALAKIAK